MLRASQLTQSSPAGSDCAGVPTDRIVTASTIRTVVRNLHKDRPLRALPSPHESQLGLAETDPRSSPRMCCWTPAGRLRPCRQAPLVAMPAHDSMRSSPLHAEGDKVTPL